MRSQCYQRPAFESADSWFLELYLNLGESIPDDPNAEQAIDAFELAAIEHENHPLWTRSLALSGTKGQAPRRFLNPGTFEDLYNQHTFEKGDEAVARSTLKRCFDAQWSQFISRRNIGQGKRCKRCAELDERRQKATSQAEKYECDEEKDEHINETKLDRLASSRSSHLSRQSFLNPTTDGFNHVAKITLDGFDQAKCKVPRNIASNAEWADSWRPALHFVGAIYHDRKEYSIRFGIPHQTITGYGHNIVEYWWGK